jgi:hypothetical protein
MPPYILTADESAQMGLSIARALDKALV